MFNFADRIRFIIENGSHMSKKELLDDYFDVTIRFLEELISARALEDYITKVHGDEEGTRIIEEVSTQGPALSEGDDKVEQIKALIGVIENSNVS